jgi:hypothetical protein
MITQRFRPVFWVAGVAVAATALYTVSLRVANERGRLESLDRQIVIAKRDIRQLQTELGSRGSLRQLERWNGEVLALVSPGASQFLPNEAALRRVDGTKLPATGYVPAPVMISTAEPKAAAGAISGQGDPKSETLESQAERVAMLDETLVKGGPVANPETSAKSSGKKEGKAGQ